MHELDVVDTLLYTLFDVTLCIFGLFQLRPESQFFLHVRVWAVGKDNRHGPPHVYSGSETGRLQIRTVAFHSDLFPELLDVGIFIVHVTDSRHSETKTLRQGEWVPRIAVDMAVDQAGNHGVAWFRDRSTIPWDLGARHLFDLAILYEHFT